MLAFTEICIIIGSKIHVLERIPGPRNLRRTYIHKKICPLIFLKNILLLKVNIIDSETGYIIFHLINFEF